jgi:hypothetical protein
VVGKDNSPLARLRSIWLTSVDSVGARSAASRPTPRPPGSTTPDAPRSCSCSPPRCRSADPAARAPTAERRPSTAPEPLRPEDRAIPPGGPARAGESTTGSRRRRGSGTARTRTAAAARAATSVVAPMPRRVSAAVRWGS